MTTKTVFLGGTCNNSTWRETLKPMLKINYFDPVVKDWNAEAQEKEMYWRKNADFVLYVISKEMLGSYSIAEVVDDSNKRPSKTIFCVLDKGTYETHVAKSLAQTSRMIALNGARVCSDLEEVAELLNS